MKVSGFSIIRNAVLMDYPVLESLLSLLPIVDELVIGVGQSDDQTKELIQSINDPKLKIFDAHWDTQKMTGGLVLSEKTNEALSRCANDWCIYLQGDEVLHESDYSKIQKSLSQNASNPDVHGLLFDYIHFYGSYHVVASSRRWYRREVRAIKKSSGAQSVGDAQSFRIRNGDKWIKPNVKHSDARVFHYGWVKPPDRMRRKKKLLDRWWHGDKLDSENENFDFEKLYGLNEYRGVHPRVMNDRIAKQDWNFNYKRSLTDWTLKDVNLAASDLLERTTGYRIGEYRSYKWLRD